MSDSGARARHEADGGPPGPAEDGATRGHAEVLKTAGVDTQVRAEAEALLGARGREAPGDAPPDARADPAMLPPPDVRFRILERLGGGGMGVVYRARDERLARDVALKFLPPHLHADPVAKQRFLVEARAAAALEHPNICTVHEIGETRDGQLYIVMACYEGETLDRHIARAPLPVHEALRVAGEIARGLAQAHERGIVHRDVKPANVMLTRDGLVKILDFGIAKLADVTLTRVGGAIGTLAYMSPEQAFAEVVDHRTDLWSLGVVLYEMLTGGRPFRGEGEQAVLVAALTADPEPVHALRPEVSPAVDAVIRRALAKKAEDRYASALEMAAAIAACPTHPAPAGAVPPPAAGPPAGPAPEEARDSALARGGERRQVTVVASALAGHDALVERVDPDEADRWIVGLRDAAIAVATQYGGLVNQFTGEGLVLLFGVPAAREDDAVRAVRAVLALHARVVELAAALPGRLGSAVRLCSGVHVGAVVAQRMRHGERRFRVAGAPADLAARLAAVAAPDEVLVTPETRRLVAPFVLTEERPPMALAGMTTAVRPHRLLSLASTRSRLEASPVALTPFVGREGERALLAGRLAAAGAGEGHVTVLIGEAGAGKSRLLLEVRRLAHQGGMRTVLGRCDAHGGTTPFLPFVEAAHEVLGVARGAAAAERHAAVVAAAHAVDPSLDEYLPLLLALLDIPSEVHVVAEHLKGESFHAAMLEAIGALFTLAARLQPMLLLLEDWHWADEPSRAALRQLTEVAGSVALLVLVTARPEGGSAWQGDEHQTPVHLSPLDGSASASIAQAVFGAARVAPALLARLHERTGGNPFFLEEVCEALREEGAVAVVDGEAVAVGTTATVHVPETVQGVLRARIDRLEAEARDVLRIASVVGREFTRGVLEAVVEAGPDGLTQALERLKRSGLVQQVAVVPEATYRFKHALTEEVAYDSLLEHQRTTLHARVGAAMEQRYAAQLDKHVERLAYHFSRAEAWEAAVRYAMRSAERAAALGRDDDALATLERAEEWVRRLPEGPVARGLCAEVLLQQERACETLGHRARQLAIAEALIALLAPHGPSRHQALAYLRLGDAYTLLRRHDEAEAALGTSLRMAEALGDTDGERQALRSVALLRTFEGRHAEALQHIERVLAIGREVGDTRAAAGDTATQANILRAMGDLPRARDVLLSALEHTAPADNPIRYSALLCVTAVVYQDLGDLETALAYFQRVGELGLDPRLQVSLFPLPNMANIRLRQGRVDEALALFRTAVEMNTKARFAFGTAHAYRSWGDALVGLQRHAEAVPALTAAAALFGQLQDRPSESLLWQRIAEAHEALREPGAARAAWLRLRALAAGDDPAGEADALAGAARAERALRGDPAVVQRHYREALAVAARAGDASRLLGLHNALGIVLWEAGDYAGAVDAYEAALHLCEQAGDRVHEGLILNSLGVSLLRLGRLAEAEARLSRSVAVTEATGERQLQGHALSALGDVALAQGHPDDAREWFARSLALRQRLGDRRGEGWMHERLARARRAVGAADDAAALARTAAEIAGELGDEALARAAGLAAAPDGSPAG